MNLNSQPITRSRSEVCFRRYVGFSLIELMVVVAIIGVLSAIALPAYNGYVLRGKQSAAKAVLLEIAQKQPMFLADRRSTYSDSLSALNVTVPDDVAQHYSFSVQISSPPPSYAAMAVPNSVAAGESSFHIDQSGAKLIGTNGVAGTETW